MNGREEWEVAALLTALPKDIGIALQPTSDGGWRANVVGIDAACGEGTTEEEAQGEALAVLHQLLIGRCVLARRALAGQVPSVPSVPSVPWVDDGVGG